MTASKKDHGPLQTRIGWITEAALEKKAEDIVAIPLSTASGIADFFIICQGDNTVHNRAIADGIDDALAQHGEKPWHIEGAQEGSWILLDYSDIVIHVMLPELRSYYGLERLWNDRSSRGERTGDHEK